MKIKTRELVGRGLDWAVALALGGHSLHYDQISSWWFTIRGQKRVMGRGWNREKRWAPSLDWDQCGSLVTHLGISLIKKHDGWWQACVFDLNDEPTHIQLAESPLTAAMRCLVASKLGDEVEIPGELR